MMANDRARLRHRLQQAEPIIAPGVYDGLSARAADAAGFDALYLSGYGVSASLLAKPDNGFLRADDMQFRIATLCETLTTPLIADADTGFGDIDETQATVRAYEQAGAAGIQIEDQQVPKICGHIPGREVVPQEAAVAKIAAAVAARQDPDFLIVARTDAREQHGLDEAIERGRQFHEAGADIIFIESPESAAEFATIGAAFSGVPLLANMVEGGRSPLIERHKLAEMGFSFIIYPVAAMAATAASLHHVYAELAEGDVAQERVSFQQLSALVGFETPEKD
jgi:2-methylisocitrate lyase-like PEP mutase family enzyme